MIAASEIGLAVADLERIAYRDAAGSTALKLNDYCVGARRNSRSHAALRLLLRLAFAFSTSLS